KVGEQPREMPRGPWLPSNSPEVRHSADVKTASVRITTAPIVFAEAPTMRRSAAGEQSVERKDGSPRDTATIQ
ncbi:hypothetical protein B30_20378, partial [Celeribacter baekdonensis B30]